MSRRARPGSAHLVGAGPGDPGLLTLRAAECLAGADLVISDALVPEAILRSVRPGAEVIHPDRSRRLDQAAINRIMISRARRGLRVVRLKGGDPSLFGRGGEEAAALARAGVPFEVVPGVTAALGAAATAGIPLTHRLHASSVTFATGHVGGGKSLAASDWEAMARAGTLVVYMTMARLASIVDGLLAAGRRAGTPAALVRWATLPEQRVVAGTLGTIVDRARRAGLRPPALLVVGEVVRLRPDIDWFGRRPLHGRTIVVTRARAQSASLTRPLEEAGARVLVAPAIAFRPPRSWAPVDRALARLDRYRILIFTSANGVARFFDRLLLRRIDIRELHGLSIVAIGPGTAAALESRGLRVTAVPEEYRAEGILSVLRARSLRGIGVLIPRAEVARGLLAGELKRRGARVDVVPVYRTVPTREGIDEVLRALRAREVDLITFASSSTVAHFARKARRPREARLLRSAPAAVIGPITAEAARRRGFKVAVMPREYTIPALAAAIVRRLRSSPSGTPRGS